MAEVDNLDAHLKSYFMYFSIMMKIVSFLDNKTKWMQFVDKDNQILPN
jgi:hypothetical protein